MQQAPSLIGVVLVFAYFAFLIFWLPYATRRVEPALRDRIGRRLGVRLVRGTGVRSGLNWQAEGKQNAGRGCQVMMWEGMAVIVIYVLPVILALGLLGGILNLSSG